MLKSLSLLIAGLFAVYASHASPAIEELQTALPVDIGDRRELFVDDALIERLSGGAELRLHHPVPKEIVLVTDAPWEGSGSSGYHSVFRDGDVYRMYYKGWHIGFDLEKKKIISASSSQSYAESRDGKTWEKPDLGLIDYQGATNNNIVAMTGLVEGMKVHAGLMAVFKDENPAAAADAQYKAFGVTYGPKDPGIVAFKSPDGFHWTPMADRPVITNGSFDNQNVAFWNPSEGKYRAYWRYFAHGDNVITNANPKGVRAIRTATSTDFIHWEGEADVVYFDSPEEALYTTPIKPYERAPHILLGFPARYVERDVPASQNALPEQEHRQLRKSINPRYGTAITEGILMASRDGVHFKRWNEAFLRPGIERPGTWNYGQQFISWHPVITQSDLFGAPDELSLYAPESYWTGDSSEVRRYTLRLDGFVSVQAPMSGGELVTKPIRFTGSHLELNFSTSAAGSVRVEIQDAATGKAIPGFSLEDCPPIFGDAIDRSVVWQGGEALVAVAGRAVRLRFVLRDADLYAYKFGAE